MAHVPGKLYGDILPFSIMLQLHPSWCIWGLCPVLMPGEPKRRQHVRHAAHTSAVTSNMPILWKAMPLSMCVRCGPCDIHNLQKGMHQLADLPPLHAIIAWLLPHSEDVVVLWLCCGCANNCDRRGGCSFQCSRNRSMATLWLKV